MLQAARNVWEHLHPTQDELNVKAFVYAEPTRRDFFSHVPKKLEKDKIEFVWGEYTNVLLNTINNEFMKLMFLLYDIGHWSVWHTLNNLHAQNV